MTRTLTTALVAVSAAQAQSYTAPAGIPVHTSHAGGGR